jgi:hypothetical protein
MHCLAADSVGDQAAWLDAFSGMLGALTVTMPTAVTPLPETPSRSRRKSTRAELLVPVPAAIDTKPLPAISAPTLATALPVLPDAALAPTDLVNGAAVKQAFVGWQAPATTVCLRPQSALALVLTARADVGSGYGRRGRWRTLSSSPTICASTWATGYVLLHGAVGPYAADDQHGKVQPRGKGPTVRITLAECADVQARRSDGAADRTLAVTLAADGTAHVLLAASTTVRMHVHGGHRDGHVLTGWAGTR